MTLDTAFWEDIAKVSFASNCPLNKILLFILTQTSFFPRREVDLIRVRNPFDGFISIFIKLILPGPGFEPVTSRVAGRRCPCILSHLTHCSVYIAPASLS